ncbi:thiaminase II/PqqC family protein [Amycolatopsis panacis]|uniref:Transcriptional regulator n=1 Tax=Amycolatopsis panacis TaxID=2340917 RepID=A0A419I3E4_9PSEU|nr:transcriptional regulator [Amycolatopsis panacis]RJQ84659.1 transcriptional regulator [Amycolatopsis panacis]
MACSARDVIAELERNLKPGPGDNKFIPLVAEGRVPLPVLGAFAAEQIFIIRSAQRSFLTLAACSEELAIEFFTRRTRRANQAIADSIRFAEACGFSEEDLRDYEPLPGCQAYAAYYAWLALNGDTLDVALAMVPNYDTWGTYCGQLLPSLREIYEFTDDQVAFFELFTPPPTELDEQAVAVIQQGLDEDWRPKHALRYGRLLQSYELMFWNTLADRAGS